MKRKFLLILITILLSFCAACKSDHQFASEWKYDNDYHWHECIVEGHTDTTEKVPHEYSDESELTCSVCGRTKAEPIIIDDVQYWINGRNYTVNYNGAYTSTVNNKTIDSPTSSEEEIIIESFNGKDKYINKQITDYFDDDETHRAQLIQVIEPAKNGNITCAKTFYSHTSYQGDTEDVSKYANYVSPSLVYELMYYSPSETFNDNGASTGDTKEEIKEAFAEHFKQEDIKHLDSLIFVRNTDNSVSLVAEGHVEFETQDITGVNVSVQYQVKVEIQVLDGKVVTVKNESTIKYNYEDSSLDSITNETETVMISYEFDEKLFNSVDTTTDEISNDYYGSMDIYLDEYSVYLESINYEVGTTITLSEIKEEIFNRISFWNGDFVSNVDLQLYYDKEKTKPVASDINLNEEEYDLYLTITPHKGYSIVLVAFDKKNYKDEIIRAPHMGYLVEEGSRFFPRGLFTDYQIILIDGTEVGEYTSFVCEENRVYAVVYDSYSGTEVVIDHSKYVEEWTFDANYHWHQCDDCGNEQLEWGPHLFETIDGKEVCSKCGYEQ